MKLHRPARVFGSACRQIFRGLALQIVITSFLEVKFGVNISEPKLDSMAISGAYRGII